MERKLVSCVLTTHCRPNFLITSLKSLQNQKAHDFEVIVVNDGSIPVENIVDHYGKNLMVTYVKHDKNRGLGSARNTGIKLSRGEYLIFLDDDDVFYPEHISTLATFLVKHPKLKVAYTDSHRQPHTYDEGGRLVPSADKIRMVPPPFSKNKMLGGNFIPVCCVMFKKSILDEVGMFDETLESHEDWDLWVRMASKDINFVHVNAISCEVSWRQDTMSGNKNIMDSGRNKVFLRSQRYR